MRLRPSGLLVLEAALLTPVRDAGKETENIAVTSGPLAYARARHRVRRERALR